MYRQTQVSSEEAALDILAKLRLGPNVRVVVCGRPGTEMAKFVAGLKKACEENEKRSIPVAAPTPKLQPKPVAAPPPPPLQLNTALLPAGTPGFARLRAAKDQRLYTLLMLLAPSAAVKTLSQSFAEELLSYTETLTVPLHLALPTARPLSRSDLVWLLAMIRGFCEHVRAKKNAQRGSFGGRRLRRKCNCASFRAYALAIMRFRPLPANLTAPGLEPRATMELTHYQNVFQSGAIHVAQEVLCTASESTETRLEAAKLLEAFFAFALAHERSGNEPSLGNVYAKVRGRTRAAPRLISAIINAAEFDHAIEHEVAEAAIAAMTALASNEKRPFDFAASRLVPLLSHETAAIARGVRRLLDTVPTRRIVVPSSPGELRWNHSERPWRPRMESHVLLHPRLRWRIRTLLLLYLRENTEEENGVRWGALPWELMEAICTAVASQFATEPVVLLEGEAMP